MATKVLAGIVKGVLAYGLTGNRSDLAKALGNAAVDGAFERFLGSDPVRKMLDAVANRLATAGERGETDRGDVLGAALTEALLRRGHLVSELLRDRRGDSASVASALVDEFDRTFDLTDREAGLCRGAVAAFLDKALDDPEAIPGLEAEWRRLILESLGGILDRLTHLPDDVQRASRGVLIANLVATPGREVFRPGIQSPTALLNPTYRTADLIGRDEIREEILQWCDGAQPIALKLIADEHGSGKTRLCIDLCERLAERGWRVGFVGSIPAGTGIESWIWPEFFSTPAPIFVVMDYANRRTGELKALLAAAVRAAKTGRAPIRVVLTSWRAVEWWTRLKEQVDPETHSFLTGPTMVRDAARIQPLSSAARAELYHDAVARIAAQLGKALPRDTVPDLDGAVFDRPVFIMIAALAAVEERPPRWSDALDLLEWVVDRQRRLWTQEVHGDPELGRAVAQAAALVRLRMGCQDHGEAIRLLQAAPLLAGTPVLTLERVCAALRVHQPGSLYLNPALPDIVGDYLVSQDIHEDREPRLGVIALSLRRSADKASGIADTLTVLNTTVQLVPAREPVLEQTLEEFQGDYEVARAAIDVALESGDPMGRVLARVRARHPNPELSARLVEIIPWRTVVLRELAAETTAQALDLVPPVRSTSSVTVRQDRARLLYRLAYRLFNLGRLEEASRAAAEAVDIRRQLAAGTPGAFLPDLALSLNNLAAIQSASGDRLEALRTSEEAVLIYQQLARVWPENFLGHLAMALNGLSTAHSALGEREKAATAAGEAVAIIRRLVASRGDASPADLAASLHNFGMTLSELGRREEALSISEEAVEIQRSLAKEAPDSFLPDLAASLTNLSSRYSEFGRPNEALRASEEAVGIYRILAERRPEAFLPSLPRFLSNLALMRSKFGLQEEALQACDEAVQIDRGLFQKRPETSASNLAQSLQNLGMIRLRLGLKSEALTATEETVAIRRRLAGDEPEAFLPDLASSLLNLAAAQSGVGQHDEGLKSSREAVRLYRTLSERRPGTFLGNLAGALDSLALMELSCGQRDEAASTGEEAVTLYRQLSANQPGPFAHDLARALNNVAVTYLRSGQAQRALETTDEAVGVFRGLVEKGPGAVVPELATFVWNRGNCYRLLERSEEALRDYLEALRLLRGPFLATPRAHAETMLGLAGDYVRLTAALSREQDVDLLSPIVAKLRELRMLRG